MTKNTPLITIGLTCYNAEDTILEALKSAIEQDWNNKEIIIVNDCSKDKSEKKIKDFIKDYDFIKLINHPENKGFPSALNSILKNATGDYIAFFDDDDLSKPNRLSEQYKHLKLYCSKNKTNLVLCYSNRDIQMPGKAMPEEKAYAIGREGLSPFGPVVADYILLNSAPTKFTWGLFGSCTLMAPKEIFNKIGQFDTNFKRCAEWDYAIRASFEGAHFTAVNKELIIQRKTLTSDKSEKISQHFKIKLRHKHKNYLKNKKAYIASLAIAYAGKRQNHVRYYLAKIIAIILAPRTLIKN